MIQITLSVARIVRIASTEQVTLSVARIVRIASTEQVRLDHVALNEAIRHGFRLVRWHLGSNDLPDPA
jgi:hypothetical protein